MSCETFPRIASLGGGTDFPEDTPNPAVGVFGISDGDLEAGPRRG